MFQPPKDLNQKCWRYLDFTKFFDLIDSSKLYFTRIDKLEDPFEGTFPVPAYEAKNSVGLNYPNFYKKKRTTALINCWHMNDYESTAMWKLYLKSDEGIAIQSTYNRIKVSLEKDQDYYNYIGKIDYLDHRKDSINWGNAFSQLLWKKKSYEHEKELRILIDLETENPKFKNGKRSVKHGLKVNIDLVELIENIYVAPTAPIWIYNLIESLLKKYELDIPIKQSDLNGSILL